MQNKYFNTLVAVRRIVNGELIRAQNKRRGTDNPSLIHYSEGQMDAYGYVFNILQKLIIAELDKEGGEDENGNEEK